VDTYDKPNHFHNNGHSIPINKLNRAYTYQTIEFTLNQCGEKVIFAQHEIALIILLLELSIKEHIAKQ